MKFLPLLTCFLCVVTLSAQDCAPAWAYYRTITVDNNAGENLTDHQVMFELNTADLLASGKLRADGADLRVFTTDCTPLPFWGDSLGQNTTTRIWVKVPSLNAGADLELQVYYGNAAATNAADGDATFLFFDDFNAGTIDPAKWETIGGVATFAVVDSVLNYSSTAMNPGPRFKFARTVPNFTERVTFDYVGAISNSNGFGFSRSTGTQLDRLLFRQSAFGFDTINQVAFMQDTFSNGFQIEGLYPVQRFERGAFNTASVTVGVNTEERLSFTRFANVGLGSENTDEYVAMQMDSVEGFHFILSSFAATQTIFLDNIRVRKYAATSPTSTAGNEIFLDPSNLKYLIDATRVQVFPNPTTTQSQISIDYPESVELRVVNAQGQQLASLNQRINPGERVVLSTKELPAGLYFLQFVRVSDGALLHTRRLSK